MKLADVQQKRNELLTQAEAIRLKYDGTKSADMLGSELTEWTNTMDAVDRLEEQIKLLQREEKAKNFSSGIANILPAAVGGTSPDEATSKGIEIFNRFLKGGKISQAEIQTVIASSTNKAYQADDPAGGGFLVAPQELSQTVITLMKDLVFMRGLATVIPVPNSESLGVPAIDVDPSDANWTVELGTGAEDTSTVFGKRELRPHPVAKRLKLSKKLIRQVPNADSLILDRLAYKFAVTEEKAFLTGSGANQPLGVFIASSNGIPTGRDVTAAGASAIVADDLINVVFSLKAQYRRRAQWILHRDILKAVRRLKDTAGNYIWATGMGPGSGLQGTPGTLMDLPYMESEYAPNTITTGLYTAILGDFTNYWIADALDMSVQVLTELYAEANQNGYIMRKETDGMPVLSEAFARLRQA
jgi:HK97 family phage major capsid protein